LRGRDAIQARMRLEFLYMEVCKKKEEKVNVELITKEDLQQFAVYLLQQMKELISESEVPKKQWLKSGEVRKLLNISPGTLQNLRINGTVRYTKVGSILYYKLEDLNKLLEGKPVNYKEALWRQ
jgi:hypothetical protein